MICPVCRCENREAAKFCKHCGTVMVPASSGPFDVIIGCADMKGYVAGMIRTFHALKRRRRSGRAPLRMNTILVGESGTGKSSFPAIIAEALFAAGMTTRPDVTVVDAVELTGFMEHREEHGRDRKGGVVLFDDLHKLIPAPGHEGLTDLDPIVSFIDDAAQDLIVFAAARPSGFLEYLERDPAFRSRFERVFRLPELSGASMAALCMQRLQGEGLALSASARERLEAVCRQLVVMRRDGAANGHAAVQLVGSVIRSFYSRTGTGAASATVQPDDISGDAAESPTPADVLRSFDDLIGLKDVKAKLHAFAVLAQVERDRVERGLIPEARPPAVHLVLTGNPGTGKTTIARRLGALFAAMGVLERGHVVEADAARLISQYQGETRKIVNDLCDRALGGVLFIDEAYALAPPAASGSNALGHEVVDALLKRMEDDRGKFIVVAAGYRGPMSRFLKSNEGLRSRFTTILHIEDYTPDELAAIFRGFAASDGRMMTPGALRRLERAVRARHAMRDEHFANARFVRTFYEAACARAATRIAALDAAGRTDQTYIVIEEGDVPWDAPPEIGIDDVMSELDRLTGLAPVKEELRTLAAALRIQRIREERGAAHKPFTEHFIFTGNPGTGKTTVARLLAHALKAIGALETGQLVEVTEKDLVGVVVGETKQKTNEVISSAMGGVLFIDEAYTLVKAQNEHNFAREALEELLVRMENDRGRFCVVAAGYPDEMEEFLRFNPGMPSRFTTTIVFPDFTADEMVTIFRGMVDAAGLQLAGGAESHVQQLFGQLIAKGGAEFANGRTARSCFDRALKRQARRLTLAAASEPVSDAHLSVLIPEDIVP